MKFCEVINDFAEHMTRLGQKLFLKRTDRAYQLSPNNYWSTVVIKFWKARKMWDQLTRIFGWEEANMQVSGTFFKAVVQVVLIFGFETWVMNPCMRRELGRLHNRVFQQIMVWQLRRRLDGRCE